MVVMFLLMIRNSASFGLSRGLGYLNNTKDHTFWGTEKTFYGVNLHEAHKKPPELSSFSIMGTSKDTNFWCTGKDSQVETVESSEGICAPRWQNK